MEILDVVDENGLPTGQTVERQRAHESGICHRTSHVWIVRIKRKSVSAEASAADENRGILQVLLQKRSENKDSYPGCYDISSAGHIPAGADFIPSALRELKEELGVDAAPGQLIYCGQRRFEFRQRFHGKLFWDNQVSNVYLMWLDWEPEEFLLQKEEVSEVRWFDFDDCIQGVGEQRIPNCIFMEELDMVKKTANETAPFILY